MDLISQIQTHKKGFMFCRLDEYVVWIVPFFHKFQSQNLQNLVRQFVLQIQIFWIVCSYMIFCGSVSPLVCIETQTDVGCFLCILWCHKVEVMYFFFNLQFSRRNEDISSVIVTVILTIPVSRLCMYRNVTFKVHHTGISRYYFSKLKRALSTFCCIFKKVNVLIREVKYGFDALFFHLRLIMTTIRT